MVLDYKKVFGMTKEEGTAQAVLSLKEEDAVDSKTEAAAEARGNTKMEKQYRSTIDNLVEKGARHLKGEILKVEVDDARAQALMNAGYIEEVGSVAAQPVEKEIEAPIKKVITGEDTDKKDATGIAAKILGKKKAKK